MPIKVAERSKARTVFAWMAGSNPTWSMYVCVCLFCVRAALCVGSGHATNWSPVQEALQMVFRIKKLKKRPTSNRRTVET
jgi:hypothetical protein